ncbi:hypothetical protein [Absidia glauca]|uniref:Uncharacterized protein n=1 Tax=Absidia glauca TaxID=4829 RepID=A0A163K6Z5_ABSGL|nr:hypothetical protein [Absidia glauca]
MNTTAPKEKHVSKTYWKTLKQRQKVDILGNQNDNDTSVLYSVPWSNPFMYSCDKAVTISKKYDLPVIFKELVDEGGIARMAMSTRKKYILMATKSKAAVSFHYKEKNGRDFKKLELVLPIPLTPAPKEPPFIDFILPPSSSTTTTMTTVSERNADAGIVLVTTTGQLLYWPRVTDSTRPYKDYQLPLGFKEEVTCTSVGLLPGSAYQVMVGTSIGNVYLMQLFDTKGQLSLSCTSLYQKTISSTVLGSLWSYISPSASSSSSSSSSSAGKEEDDNHGAIIKIMQGHTKDEIVLLSTLCCQIWALSPSSKATLISRTHLQSAIEDYAIPSIIPQDLNPNIKVDLLDMDRYGQSEWAVLVSYYIPEMDNFSQFALVCMKQLPKDHDSDSMPFQFLKTYSLPYSYIPSALKRRPSLQLSDRSIAFVSFDNTVVSIATTSDSLFEHSLVLRQDTGKDNQIIAAVVKEQEDGDTADETWATALVFTTNSGVLEYKVDYVSITESQSTGNVHAIDFEDEKTRDMALLRSKLEQAIFFGYNNENPLYFPFKLDQNYNIGDTVVSLAKEIVTGDSALISSTLDTRLSLAQRLKVTQRIPDVLKKTGLLNLVDTKLWIDLWAILQSCYIGIELMDFVSQQRTKDTKWVNCINLCLENAAIAFSDRTIIGSADQNQHEILSSLTLSLPKILKKMDANSLNACGVKSSTCHRSVNYVALFIHHLVSRLQPLENFFVCEYVSATKNGDLLEFFLASDSVGILSQHFTNLKACSETLNEWGTGDDTTLTDTLAKYGDLLLTVHRGNAQLDSRLTNHYQQETKAILDTLSDLGMKDVAITLARTHHYYPTLVACAHDQPAPQCQQLVDEYIQSYGIDFVRSLLQFYSDNNDEEKLLNFDPAYDEAITEILDQNLNIAWKYHLKKENYEKVYILLKSLLPTAENLHTRKTLLSQTKLAYLTVNTISVDSTRISTVLESDEMKRLTIDLDLIESQEQTLSKLKTILAEHAADSEVDQVQLVIEKTSSHLVETQASTDLAILTQLMGRLLLGLALRWDEYVRLLSLMDNNGPSIDNYLYALYFTRVFSTMTSKGETGEQSVTNLNFIWKAIYSKDDWNAIDKCVRDRGAIDLSKILNQTTLYRVLLLCKKQGVVGASILRPREIQLDPALKGDRALGEAIRSHRLDTYFEESIVAISII